MVLKTGDLDLQGQIGLVIHSFDYLKVLHFFKTCDLDLDLQGKIGLQTCKIFVLKIDLIGVLPLH